MRTMLIWFTSERLEDECSNQREIKQLNITKSWLTIIEPQRKAL